MCRFAAYIGRPLLINDVMSRPKVSLIKQSTSATETDVTLNGDGFGIGWYTPEVSENPAVFVSPLPAWNDTNLKNMSHQIKSPCFFAHVRAAGEGSVNQSNCHPFHFEKYLMMHNGGIGGFKTVKLALLNQLTPKFFDNIKGQTDSEILFALWLTELEKISDLNHAHRKNMTEAWENTLAILKKIQDEHQIKDATHINVIITNGIEMIGIRYVRNADRPLTLHYTAGAAFCHSQGACRMIPKNDNEESLDQYGAILIASENITGDEADWENIPDQYFIFVDRYKRIHLDPIKNI
jgi:predicted glutamine amidotransferase